MRTITLTISNQGSYEQAMVTARTNLEEAVSNAERWRIQSVSIERVTEGMGINRYTGEVVYIWKY